MSNICANLIHVCRLRVTRLNADGTTAAGPNNAYVTDQLMSLGYDVDTEEGDEHILKSGCGRLLASLKDDDAFKRFTFSLDLAAMEPGLQEMLTGGTIITAPNGDLIGVNFPLPSTVQPKVGIEAWVDNVINGGDYPAVGTNQRYTRFIWPATKWRVAGSSLENDFIPESVEGFSMLNSVWGVGPHNDQGGRAIGAAGGKLQSDVLPTVVCGYKTVGSGS